MNELLQKHGCSNVFTVPEGLRELMSDITREVLRAQPEKIFNFIANYLSALLITREHGIMAVKILDDLCDCRPSVSEHLLQLGMDRMEAEGITEVIKQAIEAPDAEPEEGTEKVKETSILKKILTRFVLDEETTAKVTQVARNAYRDYWYRKLLLEQSLKPDPNEPWEVAAQHTLNIYKKTKPSFNELSRATEKIQAAYQGYHVRRNLLRHLKPKLKPGPKVELPGPPIDIADSREIDLGRVIDIKVKEDNVGVLFDMDISGKLGLSYDPMRTITHVADEPGEDYTGAPRASRVHGLVSSKSLGAQSDMTKLAQAGSIADRRESRPSISSQGGRSRLMSEMKPESRVSQVTSSLSQGRQSRQQSQIPGEVHSLSFADAPPEVITVPGDGEEIAIKKASSGQDALEGQAEVKEGEFQEVQEVQEAKEVQEAQEAQAAPEVQEGQEIPEAVEVQEDQETGEVQEAQEVQEAIQPEAPEAAQEVPEDITTADDRTEGDGTSAPASTVGDTDATDLEDLNTTGEDEGE